MDISKLIRSDQERSVRRRAFFGGSGESGSFGDRKIFKRRIGTTRNDQSLNAPVNQNQLPFLLWIMYVLAMLSDRLRTRLQALNRAPLPEKEDETDDITESSDEHATILPASEGNERELPPGKEVNNDGGTYYLIREPLSKLWNKSEQCVARGCERLEVAASDGALHPDIATLKGHFPDRALFLDLETCGFAGSMVFLVGLIHWHQEELVLSQLLARDYSEERAMFTALWQVAAECESLCTFNGKSFDWPVVHDRSTLHHVGRDMRPVLVDGKESQVPAPHFPETSEIVGERDWPRPNLFHIDLLHHSRRRWKKGLPNCKLQTLERFICGRRRTDDIPGSEIPAAYHDYVRSKDALQMRSILHHNALDLITLVQLVLRIAS